MITFLAKHLIKSDPQTPAGRTAYGVLCGVVGISLNILLFLGKYIAGMISGSIAITADAFNNLSDAGSSVITLAGFKLADKKPDPQHPFGHGRMEYITGLIVAFLILIMGVELLKSSVEKIAAPEDTEFQPIIIAILAVSIAVKLYMALYNRRIGRRINSAAMAATSIDSLSDCIATTVVLAGTLVTRFTGVNIDGWCGLAVAAFICFAGVKAARETINPLLGNPPEKEFVDEICETVCACESILGMHDLIVHDYGPGRVMISLHAEVPASGDILALHDAVDNLEHELAEKLGCVAVIHMDPVVTGDEHTNELHEAVRAIVKKIDPCLTMHDFRIVPGPTHTNLIFDVVTPFDFRLADGELTRLISDDIHKTIGESYFAVIDVDKNYTCG